MGASPVSGDRPARLRAAVAKGSGQAFVTGVLCVAGALGVRRAPQAPADH
ncbi:hypothetical protein [Streptomyces chryseus]